jgi:hypothetical protein
MIPESPANGLSAIVDAAKVDTLKQKPHRYSSQKCLMKVFLAAPAQKSLERRLQIIIWLPLISIHLTIDLAIAK